LLLLSRAAFGRWLRRVVDLRVAFEGFSDHGASEARSLRDLEGNGLGFSPTAKPTAPPPAFALGTPHRARPSSPHLKR